MEIKKLEDRLYVADQIELADIERIKAEGFLTVINNRPDGEANGQPENAHLAETAKKAGLEFHFIPVGREGINEQMIEQTRAVLKNPNGKIICFCRSGMRSTILWALAMNVKLDKDELIQKASLAGYDISNIADRLV